MGNATARTTCRLIELADGLNLPVILENLVTSMLWIVPRLVKLRSRPSCQVVSLDQCRWGTCWRKRTRVAAWNCQGIGHLNLLCTGRNGICSRSKRHRIVLTGRAPCGVPWTRLAQVYPKPLANRLGDVLINSNEQLIGASFRSLVQRWYASLGKGSHNLMWCCSKLAVFYNTAMARPIAISGVLW